jgi:hypothetical protein
MKITSDKNKLKFHTRVCATQEQINEFTDELISNNCETGQGWNNSATNKLRDREMSM